MLTFQYNEDIDLSADLSIVYGGKEYPVANYGEMGFMAGDRETYKTSLLRLLCAAALESPKVVEGFKFRDFNKREVVVIDTEQSQPLLNSGGMKLLTQASLSEVPKNLKIFGLSSYKSSKQKMDAFRDLMDDIKNPGLIILDNAKDLMDDVNDVRKTADVIDELNSYCVNKKCIIINVSHYTDSSRGSGYRKLFGAAGTAIHNTSTFGLGTVRLADSVLLVKRKSRMGEYPDMEFYMDESGILHSGDYCPFNLEEKS